MVRRTYPLLERIGRLPPCPELLARVAKPAFPRDCFANGASYPAPLAEVLNQAGYEWADYGQGMLFASAHGVTMHEDDEPAVLWVLKGTSNAYGGGQQLVVGAKHATLYPGDIWIFDSRKLHGVIAATNGVWAVFSSYVKFKRPSRHPLFP